MDLLILILLIIRIAVSAFHALGFYVLYCSYNTPLCRNQRLYLMNFSFSEIMLCVFGVMKRICELAEATQAQNYILILQWTGLSLGYYLAMLMLTVDRLLKFIVDIKYDSYWCEKRTKLSIVIAWIINILVCIISLVVIPKDFHVITKLATVYLFAAFDITFVIIAIISYGCLFKTLRTVRTRRRRMSMPSHILENLGRQAKKMTFADKIRQLREKKTLNVLFVPTWIIITFLVFIMLPDQLYFYCFLLKKKLPHVWDAIISFIYCVGFISDAFIYIFLSPPVRKTLMHLLRKQFQCMKRRQSSFYSQASCEEKNLARRSGAYSPTMEVFERTPSLRKSIKKELPVFL